ncbi:MAG: malate dehydrogenase [Planctomycetota bacterium]
MSQIPARKITVVGAGYVGMTTAAKCLEKDLASEIVLIDVRDGWARGIALDLNQSAAIEGYGGRIVGTGDPALTRDSDLFIVTAGKPRKPGMSRSDLLEVNGRVIESVAEYIRIGSPDAIVIVVTNPLDVMVTLMRAKLGFPAKRVVGMAGALDAARFAWFIAEATRSNVQDVRAMVMGAHGDSMVPLPHFCTVNGVGIQHLLPADAIDAMSARTRAGGGEIVKLLESGSAFYAPAAGAVAMAKSILNDERRLLPSACLLNGHFGFEGVYTGVPAILGRSGVEEIVEIPLDTTARIQMQKTVGAIQEDLDALRALAIL